MLARRLGYGQLPKPRRYRVTKGFAKGFVAPFEKQSHSSRWLAAGVVALLAHGGVIALAMIEAPVAPPPVKKELPIVVATRPPPPPPPEPEKPKIKAPARPPSAAQAAKVITRAEDSGPADLTDFTLVTGSSESFAGGYSSAKGTEEKPVVQAPPPPPSKARPAAPARRDWSCSWPPDAEDSDLKDAYVSIVVAVDENGAASQVDILKSPGASFADAAKS